MPSNFNVNDASVVKAFKIKYEEPSKRFYNNNDPVYSTFKKTYDLTGEKIQRMVPFGFQGGIGAGNIPTFNRAPYDRAEFTSKELYSIAEVDRKTIYLAKNGGAFVDALKEVVQKAVESFLWMCQFNIFGEGNGKAGTIATSGVTVGAAGSYTLTISTATWKTANFEKYMIVNIGSGSTDKFEVTGVDPTNKQVTLTRFTGSKVPADADVIFLQGSENNMPISLRQALDATSSTLYGINVGYRWQATQIAAASAAITADTLNRGVLSVQFNFGEAPNLFVTSFTQMGRLMNQLEDQKRYVVNQGKVKSFEGTLSFSAVNFLTSAGEVPIIPHRFVDEDRLYGLNRNYVEICHSPGGPMWIKDDGTMWDRKEDGKTFRANYAAYMQNYIPPLPHFVVTGLATT